MEKKRTYEIVRENSLSELESKMNKKYFAYERGYYNDLQLHGGLVIEYSSIGSSVIDTKVWRYCQTISYVL